MPENLKLPRSEIFKSNIIAGDVQDFVAHFFEIPHSLTLHILDLIFRLVEYFEGLFADHSQILFSIMCRYWLFPDFPTRVHPVTRVVTADPMVNCKSERKKPLENVESGVTFNVRAVIDQISNVSYVLSKLFRT